MAAMEQQEKKSRASLQRQIFTWLLVFSGIMLLLLWLMQVVYLDEFYERIKNEQIENAASSVALALETDRIEQATADVAQSRDICISVYKVTSISGLAVQIDEVCRADIMANCVIHHMTDTNLSRYYDAAAAAQAAGESCYTQRIIMDAFGYGAPGEESEQRESGDADLWNRFAASNEGLPDSLVYAKLVTVANGGQYLLLLNSNISPVTATVATLRVQLVIISAVLLLLALILSTVIAHRLGRPLSGLTKSARRLAQGHFEGSFEGGGCREIDELASTLNYASAELARSDQLQQDITANISHDLRTPLTMIGGYAEFMRDFPEEDHSESIDVIISETQRLSALVRDVLDSSRLASGVETIKPAAFCLSDLLADIAGGEACHFKGSQYAVDGLQNVLNFLEKLEDEAVDAEGLVEMRICDQGCVGGVLATNNRFVARKRLEHRAKLFDSQNRSKTRYGRYDDPEFCAWIKDQMEIPEIKPRSIYKLDDNFAEAFKMAERMKKIEKALPGVNCSACGAPSCAALAEDIVRGDAKMDTCIFINRHSQASENAIRSIWGDRVRTKEINNDDTNIL